MDQLKPPQRDKVQPPHLSVRICSGAHSTACTARPHIQIKASGPVGRVRKLFPWTS